MTWKSLIPLAALASMSVAVAGFITASGSWRAEYRRPSGVPFPAENAFTQQKNALGRQLFYDVGLSASRTLSCATCHDPGRAWGDGLARAKGEGKEALPYRSPTLLNVAWASPLGWDGKFSDLEHVTFAPITNANIMNLPTPTLIARLKASPSYVEAFAAAFSDGEVSRDHVEAAIATYERTIVAAPAPFDGYVEGNELAIDAAAQRGFQLFRGKANCTSCHSGWNFTDGSFHDIGTGRAGDLGRGRLFPTSQKLQYAFKTPTLRDVVDRAPYMHDGSVPTLEAVIELYDRGGVERPSRSDEIRPLGLSSEEKSDLISFLRSLSSRPVSAASGDQVQAATDPPR